MRKYSRPTTFISFRVSTSLRKEVEELATLYDMTISRFIREVLQEWLKQHTDEFIEARHLNQRD